MAYVYQHIRLDTNNVFYICIGMNFTRAFDRHGRSNYWKRIVEKAVYRVEILFDNLTWEEACKKK